MEPSGAAQLSCPGDSSVVVEGVALWCVRPDGSRHGPFREDHSGGGPAVVGAYADGRRTGEWTEFFGSGTMKAQGLYGGVGLRVGEWRLFYEDGTPQARGTYDGGDEHGRWTWWYPHGGRERTGEYRFGVEHGMWQGWHPNGQLAFEGSYVSGEPSEDCQWWASDGTRRQGPPDR